MGRAASLAEQAAGRELAALVDGPWAPCWYWRDDLEAQQAAARDQHHRGGTAQLGDKARYRPTERWIDHPTEDGVRGRVWTYRPSSDEGAGDERAAAGSAPTPTAGGVGMCDTPHPGGADVPRVRRPGRAVHPGGDHDDLPQAAMSQPGPARRVLVTGSRTWTRSAVIRDALTQQWGDGTRVLVSGGCPRGADRIAEGLWSRWGGTVERHPADWQEHGRSAGFARNAAMVELGAGVCLAFIRDGSPGASHTARLAEQAGIPTQRHHQQTPTERSTR